MKPTPDFNPAVAAKKLLREGRSGALATLMPGSGDPYCSLVNVATAADGAPLLLISRLAVHTKNILADPRVSLMVDERKEGDPLAGRPRHADGNRGRDRRSGDPPALSRAPAGGGDVRGLRRFRVLPDRAQGRASRRRLRPHRRPQAAGHPDRDRRRRRARRRRARHPRAHERRSRRRRAGSMPPGCSARRTANGAASAATPRASSCSSTAPRCGCRSESACARRACCAQVLKQMAERGARGVIDAPRPAIQLSTIDSRMTALKVLILGGYGTFGGRLARLLADEDRLTLIIAGRSRARHRASAPVCRPRRCPRPSTATATSSGSCASSRRISWSMRPGRFSSTAPIPIASCAPRSRSAFTISTSPTAPISSAASRNSTPRRARAASSFWPASRAFRC